ncbi:MAG: hypothetical protein U9Q74_12790, partial [Gemmatimonadota bacterium]|nr:hypothetical protein [Gemmatimonadota bacterium]
HLAACAECRAELDVLRAVGRAYAVPAPDVAAIVAAIPRRGAARPVHTAPPAAIPFHRQPLWRLAASVTLIIAATATYVAVRGAGADPRAVADSVAQLAVGEVAQRPDTDVGPAAGEPAAGGAIRLGVSLSDLTDAQVEALLVAMDGMEGNVLADPEVMAKPIAPGSDGEGGRN